MTLTSLNLKCTLVTQTIGKYDMMIFYLIHVDTNLMLQLVAIEDGKIVQLCDIGGVFIHMP